VSAAALLHRAAAAGVAIRLEPPDGLRVGWPGNPDPELREAILRAKAEILALLGQPPRTLAYLCAGCNRVFFPEPARLCYSCRSSRSGAPLGPPCDGCGEACEDCLGTPNGRHRGAA
jgi:hypothetical protein